jgi:hypothetical protein
VIVVTCTDCIGFFVEYLKRLSALALAKDICGYERKVEYLTDIFEPQLRSLIGVSRSTRDWVEDNIFNPAGRGANLWGIGDLLQEIPDEFHVLGSSPQIFSDISWYKDLRAPSREEQQEQLKQKHATLLLAGSSEIRLNDVQQQMLEEGIMEIIKHGLIFEEKENLQLLEMISKSLIGMEQIASNISDEFLGIVQEASACFSILAEGLKFDYAEYPHFFKAFGRELNYIALQRDMEYTT